MAKAIITILAIVFFISPAHAGKALILADINWSNGQEIINPDGSTYRTGAIPILPSSECGEDTDCLKGGGFQGWYSGKDPNLITLKMAEVGKLPQCHVHIWVKNEENLVKISKAKKSDGSFKFRIRKLTSEIAIDKKPDLDVKNRGVETYEISAEKN